MKIRKNQLKDILFHAILKKKMNIKEVKTARKVGDFVLRKNHQNKIDIKYLPEISQGTLKDESPRVYLFVVNGIIKKIGGSEARGGIKSTMNPYVTSMTGSPGRSRYILHLLIEKELEEGSRVELYMINSPKVSAKINGLFGSKKLKIAGFKAMEDFCKKDYFNKEKKYPDWNLQENHEPYPKEFEEKFLHYHQKRIRK